MQQLADYVTMCITEAAEIATDLMLQENLGHPLCRALSLYACHLRLAHLLESPAVDVTSDASAADDGVCVCSFIKLLF